MNSKKGRILCVTSNFPRWSGDSTTPFVLHLSQNLQKLGWSIDVLAPHAPHSAKNEDIDGISIKRFQYLWPESNETVCYQGGALVNLRKNKLNLLKLPLLVFAEWFAIVRCLTKRRYDLIHSHWILPQGFTGVLAARMFGIPHVITVHGGDVFGLQGKILAMFKSFSLKYSTAVTVNSSKTYSAVTSLASQNGDIIKIPMGVKVKTVDKGSPEVKAVRDLFSRNNGPLLVFVGRIVEEKGVEDLILAVKILVNSTFSDLKALIIGEGQDKTSFEKKAKELGLSETVFFTGWIDPEEVSQFLAAGDIFVGPSKRAQDGWIEAQGLTFLEAMACGTPVITTGSGGIKDFVVDGETGLIVDEGAPDQIAQKVETLLSDAVLRSKIISNAYNVVIGGFSHESSAASFSSLFDSLISRKKNIGPKVFF